MRGLQAVLRIGRQSTTLFTLTHSLPGEPYQCLPSMVALTSRPHTTIDAAEPQHERFPKDDCRLIEKL